MFTYTYIPRNNGWATRCLVIITSICAGDDNCISELENVNKMRHVSTKFFKGTRRFAAHKSEDNEIQAKIHIFFYILKYTLQEQ